MNLLQMEYGVLPTKVLKEDKAEYIQTLIDTREEEDMEVFMNYMVHLHCLHLRYDIDQFIKDMSSEMVDKRNLAKGMVGKWPIKPSLADKLSSMADKEETKTETIVQQFGFTATSAKRYLRQLTEFGCLAAKGGNRNRTYTMLNLSQTEEK